MASHDIIPCPFVSPDVARSISRFVYDVMMYTLPICGLPDSGLPTTDVRKNVYRRPNLVDVAGVSALRVCLIMRDKWRRMFESRHKKSGLADEEIPTFLLNIVRCCKLTRDCTRQTMVEVLLAVCNEITLYFHSENVDFNSSTVFGSIGFVVVNIIGSPKRALEKVEMLFDKFDNLGEYTRRITGFIEKFAVPYGSREDVSDLFFEDVKKHHFDEFKKFRAAIKVSQTKSKSKAKPRPEPEEPSIKKLKDRLGFLPHNLYSAIVAEESVSLPENLLASGSTLPGDRDSPEPPILPPGTKRVSIHKRKSHSSRSSQSSKSSAESGHSGSGPVWRDQPLKLPTSSESGGLEENKPKSRTTKLKKAPEESKPISPGERPKSHESSASAAAEEKSGEKQATLSGKDSEQTVQGRQSSGDPTQLRLEDELKRLSLGTERTSQGSLGAIPKKREPKK